MKKLNCFLSTILLCSFITSCGNNGTVASRETLDSSASSSSTIGSMSTVTVTQTDSRYGGQYTVSVLQHSSCAAQIETIICARKLVDIECNPSVYGCYPGYTYQEYQNFTYYNVCSANADSAQQVYSGQCPSF